LKELIIVPSNPRLYRTLFEKVYEQKGIDTGNIDLII
jgi:hypothetical protein